MTFSAKDFSELSGAEVYEILKSRTEIFMLEQNIICQDMDDVDYVSTHCFFSDGKRAIAYLRAFVDENDKDTVIVGRVLTLEHGKGLGTELMKRSIDEIKKRYNCKKISIHAQRRAVGFYEKLGFVIVSDEFMEEGVPHFFMELEM